MLDLKFMQSPALSSDLFYKNGLISVRVSSLRTELHSKKSNVISNFLSVSLQCEGRQLSVVIITSDHDSLC